MVDSDTLRLVINCFAAEVHQNAIEHGWWEEGGAFEVERNFGELIALCHAELSGALEQYRAGHDMKETYYGDDDKPEGIPSELADVILRILDMCAHYRIDIGGMLVEKSTFNKTRSYKHGGKKI